MDLVTLHDATPHDAADANGESLAMGNATQAVILVEPDGYSGGYAFEWTPDGGDSWYATEGYSFDGFGSYVTGAAGLTTSSAAVQHLVFAPSQTLLRVRLTSPTAGSITVKACTTLRML